MNEHRKKIAFKLREEMEASQQSGSELKDFSGKISKKDFVILECNEACRQLERNRRLDIAFKVENPNLISYPKFQPNYSEFVRTMYKKDPGFVNGIHEKLTELVKLAKESKQVERSFSFPVMNRDKRHVVHELCEHFGVQSESYDAEPHRNVVARATKETVRLSIKIHS
jgi:transcriptional repressor NF-X1